MGRYTSVNVLRSQFDAIKELILQKGFLGYYTVSEFVRDAIREKLAHASLQDDPRKKEEEPWLK